MTKEDFLKIPGVKKKIDDLAKKHGFSSAQMLKVIEKESQFETNAVNTNGGATGLIQFYKDKNQPYKTINGVKYELTDIKEMTALEQLDLVDEYFVENHKKGQHPYTTVAYPKASTMAMDDIIAGPDDSITNANPVWVDENGNVTKRSMLGYVDYEGDGTDIVAEGTEVE